MRQMSRKVTPQNITILPPKKHEQEEDYTNGDDFPTNRKTAGGEVPLDEDFKNFLLNDPKLQMFEKAV